MAIFRRTSGLATLLLLVATEVLVPCDIPPARAQDSGSSPAVNHSITQSSERLELLVKSSRILSLEDRIPKFQVHNEDVLSATPVSQNQIQIFARIPGTTQINLWDTEDKLYTVDVTVLADAREVEGILSSQLPFASLRVTPLNESAIISGYVTSVDDVDRAMAITEQFYTTVVNNIRVVGVQQVLLHTRIMEVSRTKLRDLGIDWGSFGSSGFVYSAPSGLINAAASNGNALVPSLEASTLATNGLSINNGSFDALLTALRQQDLVKLLAEPTVVATHGRPARFTVGGKVPYLVPSGNNAIQVQFEDFGTSVDFLPFVIGPGRIRLEVRPEVSEPDDSRSINANGISVPAFTQRYVETAVEMQAGQTFAIAGLLQSRTEAVTRSTPLLGEIPVFGVLFRRVRERRNDIELLITVTPELVEAMDPHEVPYGGPGLNSMSPNDKELYIKGHIEVPNSIGGCQPATNSSACGHPQEMILDGSSPLPNSSVSYPGASSAPGRVVTDNVYVPQEQPIVVGEGVTLEVPEYQP